MFHAWTPHTVILICICFSIIYIFYEFDYNVFFTHTAFNQTIFCLFTVNIAHCTTIKAVQTAKLIKKKKRTQRTCCWPPWLLCIIYKPLTITTWKIQQKWPVCWRRELVTNTAVRNDHDRHWKYISKCSIVVDPRGLSALPLSKICYDHTATILQICCMCLFTFIYWID